MFLFALIVCDCDEWRRGLLGGYQHPLYKFLKLTHVMVGILCVMGADWPPNGTRFWFWAAMHLATS